MLHAPAFALPTRALMTPRTPAPCTNVQVQFRGSLHAHIVLFLHPDDVAHVASEITCKVPAEWRPDATAAQGGSWVRPSDPLAARLFDIVLRKQQHSCTPLEAHGCRKDTPFCW